MRKKRWIERALERAYERVLELPVPLVLAMLWLTGLALLGACALALYLFVLLLAGV